MSIKSIGGRLMADWIVKRDQKWASRPEETQERVFQELLKKGRWTWFGKNHDFDQIKNHSDFKEKVPVRNYEGLRPYIEQIIDGQRDVLWPGFPKYFAKTSGTTSGAKYIPVTKTSIPNHIHSARDALLHYIKDTGKSQFLDGNMIFLSGSPELERKGGILTGRLSGIVNHHVPSYLQRNQVPTYETNCLSDWDEKLEAIIRETLQADMRLISGIPPWLQNYFDRLTAETGKKIADLFPNFSLMVHGGVNFEPYRERLMETIGKTIDAIETYPASEGFFAFQDSQEEPGLRLNLNSGIFYEFIPLEEVNNENPKRLNIGEVETDKHYALVVSNNAGLWAYNVGDTVKFISKHPYKIEVTGRIKHFTSAFGEHVIAEEVEHAIINAAKETFARVSEFTVAPNINPVEGLPRHEWYIEFEQEPDNLETFRTTLDQKMCEQNIYYKDLIESEILDRLHIKLVRKEGFNDYMKSIGKFGGQNKLARLANDRSIADGLEAYLEEEKSSFP